MVPAVEVVVFTETTLGTRLAVAVSPDITAGDLKRELERAHSNCFRELGSISFDGLMVKKKAFLYHLTDSIPMKYVINSLEKSSFLLAKGKLTHKGIVPEACSGRSQVKSDVNHVTHGIYGEARQNNMELDHLVVNRNCCISFNREGCHELQDVNSKGECDFNLIVESSTDKSSETNSVSVSDIIHKYFSNLVELNQTRSVSSSGKQLDQQLHSMNGKKCTNIPGIRSETPGRIYSASLTKDSGSVRNTSERTQIGKRFIMASNNLFVCQNKQKPVISLRSSKRRKSLMMTSDFCVRSLVFEVNDDDR